VTLAEKIRDDRGSLTAAMVIWTPVMLVLAAFVVDVGFLIAKRDTADNIAEQAARRVADDLDQAVLRAPVTPPDTPRMAINVDATTKVLVPGQPASNCYTDAQDYLNATGEQVTLLSCVVTGNPQPPGANAPVPVVTVTVRIQSKPLFAGLVYSKPNTVTGTGTARPVGG
jgi:Flp pilus assembly protein TadG